MTPTEPPTDERDRLAYLITAKRFHQRGIQLPMTDEDVAVALPMADFLIGEGYRLQSPVTTEREELAFRNIRARIAESDVPIHVAADIEQIICEDGGDFGEQGIVIAPWTEDFAFGGVPVGKVEKLIEDRE